MTNILFSLKDKNKFAEEATLRMKWSSVNSDLKSFSADCFFYCLFLLSANVFFSIYFFVPYPFVWWTGIAEEQPARPVYPAGERRNSRSSSSKLGPGSIRRRSRCRCILVSSGPLLPLSPPPVSSFVSSFSSQQYPKMYAERVGEKKVQELCKSRNCSYLVVAEFSQPVKLRTKGSCSIEKNVVLTARSMKLNSVRASTSA